MKKSDADSFKQAKRLLIEHGAVRLLPWVVGILFLLCSVMLVAGLLSMRLAGDWQSSLENTLTVQASNQQDTSKQLLDFIRNNVDVRAAEQVSDKESAKLLTPWLGKVEQITLPIMIEVTLQENSSLDYKVFEQQLKGIDPSVSVEGFNSWLNNVKNLTRSIRLIALVIAVIIFCGLLLAIAVATKIHFALNCRIVGILHMIGATDKYIAGQFQRSAVRLVIKSIVLAIVMFLILGLMAWLFAPKVEYMNLQKLQPGLPELIAFIGLICITPLVASFISRWSAMKALASFEDVT